jgi:hypothetical protein
VQRLNQIKGSESRFFFVPSFFFKNMEPLTRDNCAVFVVPLFLCLANQHNPSTIILDKEKWIQAIDKVIKLAYSSSSSGDKEGIQSLTSFQVFSILIANKHIELASDDNNRVGEFVLNRWRVEEMIGGKDIFSAEYENSSRGSGGGRVSSSRGGGRSGRSATYEVYSYFESLTTGDASFVNMDLARSLTLFVTEDNLLVLLMFRLEEILEQKNKVDEKDYDLTTMSALPLTLPLTTGELSLGEIGDTHVFIHNEVPLSTTPAFEFEEEEEEVSPLKGDHPAGSSSKRFVWDHGDVAIFKLIILTRLWLSSEQTQNVIFDALVQYLNAAAAAAVADGDGDGTSADASTNHHHVNLTSRYFLSSLVKTVQKETISRRPKVVVDDNDHHYIPATAVDDNDDNHFLPTKLQSLSASSDDSSDDDDDDNSLSSLSSFSSWSLEEESFDHRLQPGRSDDSKKSKPKSPVSNRFSLTDRSSSSSLLPPPQQQQQQQSLSEDNNEAVFNQVEVVLRAKLRTGAITPEE